MPWQKYEIKDSRSGITDIIRNSPPSFQEKSMNLVHDNKNGSLDQRPGSSYWTDFDAPAKIRQLFQLENYIFAYCYDDPVDPEDDIDGRVYWVLSDGTSVAWTEVVTENVDTTIKIRLRDTKNKGIDIEIDEIDANFTIWYKTKFTAGSQNVPSFAYSGGNERVTMQIFESTTRINDAGYYVRGDNAQLYSYEDLKNALESSFAGWTVSYSPLTDASDDVHFSGSFEPDAEDYENGVGETQGRFIENQRAVFTKQGHLQIVKWSGHLYLSLEPFDKVFVANNDDPYAEYPDSFPPDNDRLPLRKLYIVNEDTVTYPQLSSAQLPKAFISYDYSSTNNLTSSDVSYRYAMQEISLRGTTSTTTIGKCRIWFERGFGPQPGYGITTPLRFTLSGSGGSDLIFDYLQTLDFTPNWGEYGVGFSNAYEGMTAGSFVSRLSALLNQVGSDNTYGSSFNFAIELVDIGTSERISGPPGNIGTSLWRNIPPTSNTGNFVYSYGAFLRDEYQAQFEGAPRTFIFDGPTSITSVTTLSEINENTVQGTATSAVGPTYNYPKAPSIWIGIAKTKEYATSLYLDDHLSCQVARSLANGSTDYLSREVFQFKNISTNTPPADILYNEEWERDVGQTFEYDDEAGDQSIDDNETAYYNGGVALYDARPQGGGYYFTVVNQTGYYANIIGNVQRVYESPPGVPHASPGLFFEDFDDTVTGISHFSDKPIIFTPNTTWRWEGTNGATGAGRTFIRVVSDEFGCISNQSVVRTNQGLFYWSKTGIIFTNGLKALRVTEHLIDTYANWLSYIGAADGTIGPSFLRGFYDEINRRVLWASINEDGEPVYIVLDIFEGVSDKMPVFMFSGNSNTVWDGAEYITTDQFQTVSSLFSEDDNRVYRAQDGRVLTFSEDNETDGYWDGTEVLEVPIKSEFKSVAIDYGHRRDRKWTSKVMYNFEDLTQNGVSIQPLAWNDLTDVSERLGPCLNYQHVVWSDDYATFPGSDLQQFFKHSDVQFKSEHLISYNRRFTKNRIRNVFKQVGWEPLPVKAGDITVRSNNVDLISVSYVSGTGRNLVKVIIDVSDNGDNVLVDLGVDNSGSYYLKWDNQIDYVKVQDITLVGSQYEMQVFASDESINDFTYTDVETITVGKVLAQKLKLSDYSLTFKLLSDSTHGIYQSPAKGGDNGN